MYDLAVVMPVYNEEACIIDVVKSWYLMLSRLNINFRMIILNDGSTDNTKDSLKVFKSYECIKVINKKNSGHGSTILFGYRMVLESAEWVFQCDSDDEMQPQYFAKLWENRQKYDALFGVRQNRSQNFGRKIISSCSRLIIRCLFGKGVSDVNTPYRLMRSKILKQIIKKIPDDAFAPNIIISGILSYVKARIYEYPVPHENRKTGSVSIVKWKLWKSAWKAFVETLFCLPKIDKNFLTKADK